jgi:hypothetical protein
MTIGFMVGSDEDTGFYYGVYASGGGTCDEK